MISCTGNVTLKQGAPFVHAHALFGDRSGGAFGGHLMSPSIVFAAEIHILELSGQPPERIHDPATGLYLWPDRQNSTGHLTTCEGTTSVKLINWTLRKNFLIPTLVLIVLGMGISTIISYVRTRAMMNESAMAQMTQMSAMTTKNIGFWIDSRKIEVANWATEQIFAEALNDTDLGRETRFIADEQFEAFKKNAAYYEVIALANKKGELVASTNRDALVGKINVADYPFFKQALAGKQTISDAMISKTSGKPYFAIASPVFSLDKTETLGALIGVINIEYLSSQLVEPIKVGKDRLCLYFKYRGPDHCTPR